MEAGFSFREEYFRQLVSLCYHEEMMILALSVVVWESLRWMTKEIPQLLLDPTLLHLTNPCYQHTPHTHREPTGGGLRWNIVEIQATTDAKVL